MCPDWPGGEIENARRWSGTSGGAGSWARETGARAAAYNAMQAAMTVTRRNKAASQWLLLPITLRLFPAESCSGFEAPPLVVRDRDLHRCAGQHRDRALYATHQLVPIDRLAQGGYPALDIVDNASQLDG